MGVPFVQTNQATNVNGLDFGFPNNVNGTTMQIPCESTEIIGSYWRIPQTQGGRVIGYQYIVAQETSTKPQDDALKILRVKLTSTAGITQIDMAIVDADNMASTSPPNQFAYLCDGSGGTLPVMPTVTIPYPILQNPPQDTDTSTGDNTFIFSFPANPAGLEYTVNGEWYNGSAPTPAYAPSGITTVAGVAAWYNTNRSDYGTWTNPSTNILKLVSADSDVEKVLEAGINVELEPTDFCFDLSAYSTPAAVNQVKFGTGDLINITPFLLTNSPVKLMNVLIPRMNVGAIFDPTSVANKLGINTVMAIPKLYNDGVLVEASTAGAC